MMFNMNKIVVNFHKRMVATRKVHTNVYGTAFYNFLFRLACKSKTAILFKMWNGTQCK